MYCMMCLRAVTVEASCHVRFMMTSSNGNSFRVTGHLCGEFIGPAQRPVTRSFDILFDPGLNKQLSKQLWGWWFETLSCSLRHHCNVNVNGNGNAIKPLTWSHTSWHHEDQRIVIIRFKSGKRPKNVAICYGTIYCVLKGPDSVTHMCVWILK